MSGVCTVLSSSLTEGRSPHVPHSCTIEVSGSRVSMKRRPRYWIKVRDVMIAAVIYEHLGTAHKYTHADEPLIKPVNHIN